MKKNEKRSHITNVLVQRICLQLFNKHQINYRSHSTHETTSPVVGRRTALKLGLQWTRAAYFGQLS